jgi:hypothetical protein
MGYSIYIAEVHSSQSYQVRAERERNYHCEDSRLRLKRDGTRTETTFHFSAKQMSPFKSAGTSAQSTTGSQGVHISGSNAAYTMFWGSVKSNGYPLHLPVSPSLPLPCVTVCHHVSAGLYTIILTFPLPWLETGGKAMSVTCWWGSSYVKLAFDIFIQSSRVLMNVSQVAPSKLVASSSFYKWIKK